MSDVRFETYYPRGLGARYALRGWIVVAVLAAIGIPVTWFTYVGNPQWWVLVTVGLVFGVMLLLSIVSAVGSPAKWSSDGGLAVRLDEAGITLPRVGTLAWDEITAIRIMDTGGVHASIAIRAWEAITGSSSNQYLTVWVRDADAVVERSGGRAAAARNFVELEGHHGFDGAWGEGLRSPGWEETVAAVQRAATAHGIPLHGRKITAES